MEHEKSFLYTLVLGGSILISLLLVGRMLLYQPVPIHSPHMAQTEQSAKKGAIYMSDTDLTKLLKTHMPESFPIDITCISISRDGTVHADGTVDKEKLNSMREMELFQALKKWMPESFSIQATFTAVSDNGRLILTPKELKAAGFMIPIEQLPQDWLSILNGSVNRVLYESEQNFTDIKFLDGGLQLLP